MQLLIRLPQPQPDAALREYVHQRLHFALGRFAPQIRQVRATLRDLNGPRGGVDHEFRLTARLADGQDLSAVARDETPAASVDRAAGRLARAAARCLKKSQSFERRSAAGPQ